MNRQLTLSLEGERGSPEVVIPESFEAEMVSFSEFGARTITAATTVKVEDGLERSFPTYINEFWTAGQRQANRLHEVSYRACFKPQLPRFFIERLTRPGEVVHDPFLGRGTTAIESALLGRVPYGCDVNPLSLVMTRPRLEPPELAVIHRRLDEIDFDVVKEPVPEDLLVFYHPTTLTQICALREYLMRRRVSGEEDGVDRWIALVALNRLTGHSPGFFSVYTLPPNQAVSVKSQTRINERRKQVPQPRSVPDLICRKSRGLLSQCDNSVRRALAEVSSKACLLNVAADQTGAIPTGSVSLVVTSPPFLDIVDYATDNWLRGWFLGIDPAGVKLTVPKRLDAWEDAMTRVFNELDRVLKVGGHVAFEVGEVHQGKTRLEEAVIRCGLRAGLEVRFVLINAQEFTKTAHCWGVDNNSKGTNSNRIVLFRKAAVV